MAWRTICAGIRHVVLLAFDEGESGRHAGSAEKAMVRGITQGNAQIVFEGADDNLRKGRKSKIGNALERTVIVGRFASAKRLYPTKAAFAAFPF